jgi:hypothetical protein
VQEGSPARKHENAQACTLGYLEAAGLESVGA